MTTIRVLSVGDESLTGAVSRYLERSSDVATFRVETATTAADALAVLEQTDIDCVVSDTALPDSEPLAFLERTRNRESNLPILLFADGAGGDWIDDAFEAGLTDYVQRTDSDGQYAVLAHRIHAAVDHLETHQSSAGIERAKQIVEHAADAIFVTDTEGTIEYANPAFEDVTGFEIEEAIGQNPRILKSGKQDQTYYERLWAAILDGEVWEEEVVNERKSGDRYHAHQTIAPVVDDNDDVTQFVAVQRDVTDHRLLEDQIEQSATALSELHDVALETTTAFDDKLEQVLEIGTSTLEFPIGYVTKIEDETQEIIAAVGEHDLLQPGSVDPLERTYCRRTIESDDPVVVDDAAADPEWRGDPAFERFDLRCYVGATIVVDGEVYGTLCFASQEPRDPVIGQVQQSTVKALAQWAGYELERRRYERTLERYEDIVENVPVGMYRTETGEDGSFLEVNEAMVDMFDASSPAEVLDCSVGELARDRDRLTAIGERLETRGVVRNEVIEFETLGGNPFYGSISAIERETADGTRYVDGIVQDVTERERAKAALAQSRERLQVLFEQSPDAILVHDSDGKICDANQTQIDQLGYTHETLCSMNIADVEVGIQPSELRDVWDDLEGDSVLEVEGKHRRADGSTYPVEVWVSRIEFGDEKRFLALSRDITERKEHEQELERARSQLRQVIDLVPEMIFAKSRSGEYLLANEAVAEVYGRPVEEIVGRTDHELLESSTEAETFRQDDLRVIDSGEPMHVPEEEFTDSDGVTRLLETTKIPFEVAGTGETAVLGYARDVTALKEQRDRLELLNQVVRHDVRNDMQVVKGRAQLLEETVEASAMEHVTEIIEAADAAIELTKTARDLTETMLKRDEDLKPMSLRYILESRIEAMRSQFSHARFDIDGILPDISVMADEMLESVLDNLLVNAVVHNDSDQPRVTVSVSEHDEQVVVTVADNGPGIPDSQKTEIFGKGEKAIDSPGTGLGLYLVRTLVQQYGGDVWVEDNDPRGSRFEVAFESGPDS
ncbi:PAS domain S-box protein [Salinadaptatus halalkaliphilus]|uniref:histidine kinase n=1 Tax=Salinadaptatus halalkaliphilus TaxID=2419781 RepID=A0A4S3TFV0_9EURY|nr:PAS domain S-box protein [Salinadaptatus halalkaliphilus]THE62784.1 PAS domain S-box protein [Salinadaptatus halalkaliphilus]